MSVEFEKLIAGLKCGGFEVAAAETRGVSESLKNRGLIPRSLDGPKEYPVFDGTFGDQVRLYRKRRNFNLSQRRLSKKVGVDHSTLSRIEAGCRAPTLITVVNLIEGLKLNPEQTISLLKAAAAQNHKKS